MDEDTINLTASAAEGISLALDSDFMKVESPERMAWVVLLLKKIPDDKDVFPMGKWATIQSIESQIKIAADLYIYFLQRDKDA